MKTHNKKLISRNIEQFYNKASEETRLEKGMGLFEFERIKYLIEKYLHLRSSTIIDIGGGTGKYSEWLTKKGHYVHMVEPVEKHIKIAEKRAEKLKKPFSIHMSSAHPLAFPSNFADLVILHGPLYHLQKKEERLLAINEAKRVVKTGGIILGVSINYTASTLVGLLNGLIHHKDFFAMCKDELQTGIHLPPEQFPWLLAEAYFHRPDELKSEFQQAGLSHLNTYAIEGMTWLDKNYFQHLADPHKRKNLMELLAITENDDYLLPFSPHMMIAVKKPAYER